MNTNEPQPPAWQPIAALPVILDLAGAQIDEVQATFDALTRCRSRPHVLDDATLARTRQVYGEQRDFLPIQREQVARWRSGPLTPQEREALAHLSARIDGWRRCSTIFSRWQTRCRTARSTGSWA
ncbi:hypothetical protein [Cupriavidus oxalaticus]|uniref:Uncharacterized protein n=1 Tax=Cupriavidus oxalaticus TaxID=96344 RepID=A0A375FMC5_9BURK|nr:hypothetical protein [Cupriavidus oxalaticus]WQD84449.1 hypothetical protein U0036_08160 [Cupriavidus oxalaticus]SPC06646.1 hypothetical protein CO2235_U600091 [Cupriavidus oxalaticus]SPC12369.1 hypothetical protein CO2235_150024 [Cupriavidus oxalaticus]